MDRWDNYGDISAYIRAVYDSMSAGQQKVAEFVLERGAEAAYLPAIRIAGQVGVSHSTVVRMAQALGFDGFPDFQAALQEQFLKQIGPAYDLLEEQGVVEETINPEIHDSSSVFHRVMLSDLTHTRHLMRLVSVADFERTVELLTHARRVYLLGIRASAPLALHLGTGLRYIRPDCFILQPGLGDLADQLAPICEDDLLVTMSYSRYARTTLHCMDYARSVGAPVVTLTDSVLSPAAKRADIAFVAPSQMWYGLSAALYSLLNALITAVAMLRHSRAETQLEHVDHILQQLQLFEDA